MCELCTKHGEGKKWYLQAKNYADDLWHDLRRQKVAREHFGMIRGIAQRDYKLLKFVNGKNRALGSFIFRIFKSGFLKKHLGQVVTIEDVAAIFDIVNSIVRIPCVCRQSMTGKEVRYCFAVSIDPASIGMAEFVDASYGSGPDISRFERLTKEEALAFMKGLEPSGTIHTVWTVMTPFIGFICNCGNNGCLPMLSQNEIGPIVMKSEYRAAADPLLCAACRKCASVCLFGAIRYDAPAGKAVIDASRCYGCGICRSVCAADAIQVKEAS